MTLTKCQRRISTLQTGDFLQEKTRPLHDNDCIDFRDFQSAEEASFKRNVAIFAANKLLNAKRNTCYRIDAQDDMTMTTTDDKRSR